MKIKITQEMITVALTEFLTAGGLIRKIPDGPGEGPRVIWAKYGIYEVFWDMDDAKEEG